MRLSISSKGSALILVMWALVMMSLAVFGVIRFVAYGFDDSVAMQKDFRARQLAESGLAIGLHPQVKPGDPVLRQEFEHGERIEVVIRPEDGRLPINIILTMGYADVLRELFEQWGLEPDHAVILADSLVDWVDANHRTELHGAERDFYETQGYPQYPRNRPFETVEEMIPVRGMDRLIEIKPDWRDFFTVHGSGKLNVNGASADAISIYTKVPREQAEALVMERNGLDGLPDTEDDLTFSSLEQFRDALGTNPGDFNGVSGLLTVETTLLRVESKGFVGNRSVTLSMIAKLEKGKPPVILESAEN
jgi:general secretion pathway protein K